jgi:hypothetical protein
MRAHVLAIDPGPETSGYVVLAGGRVVKAEQIENWRLKRDVLIQWADDAVCAIEMVASYGMAVGKEVFETVLAIGRFTERWYAITGQEPALLYRKDIKMHLCMSMRAKDANIRQALIDKLGPVGTKKNQGPCYNVSGHLWSALAVAVTYADQAATRAGAPALPPLQLQYEEPPCPTGK